MAIKRWTGLPDAGEPDAAGANAGGVGTAIECRTDGPAGKKRHIVRLSLTLEIQTDAVRDELPILPLLRALI